MTVAEYIDRHGFRRWYERQLIESHAYLALPFVALTLLLAGIEVMGDARGGMSYLATLSAAALGGVLMLVAWRRFTVLLASAEQFAENATCRNCAAWGRFKVLGQEVANEDDPPEAGEGLYNPSIGIMLQCYSDLILPAIQARTFLATSPLQWLTLFGTYSN